jgi:hypothetical protein
MIQGVSRSSFGLWVATNKNRSTSTHALEESSLAQVLGNLTTKALLLSEAPSSPHTPYAYARTRYT